MPTSFWGYDTSSGIYQESWKEEMERVKHERIVEATERALEERLDRVEKRKQAEKEKEARIRKANDDAHAAQWAEWANTIRTNPLHVYGKDFSSQ